ncbi:MAG: PAS domain-containing sensor histidine kinase [Planctomycetes bacterium]|nr:PAS domain-containing sensor histidine kinase [Planctomycetota bacterium]
MTEVDATVMPRDDSYFRRLCEHAGVALIACDRNLRICVWNRAAAVMFGAASDRMLGSPIVAVMPTERRAAAEAMIVAAMDRGETGQLDFADRDAAGSPRELACTIAPILGPSGSGLGSSICIRDITRRIALQNEVNENRKLSALGRMAGAIAHHFNNILGGVITSVDYAATADDPAVTARTLRQTNRALLRASALVNGLMAFAEGDRRGEDLSDFTEIVNEVADDLERALAGQQIRLSVSVPKLPILPIGRSQWLTVLRNLTRNAIEAMPHGGMLRLEVTVEGSDLVTRISDTGCGMDEVALSHLFEPFWSTKNKLTTSEGEGTGLGLAIAHGIVQMLGGTITVESKPNEGATFIVHLPRGAELAVATVP